jgi:hypothetical protein
MYVLWRILNMIMYSEVYKGCTLWFRSQWKLHVRMIYMCVCVYIYIYIYIYINCCLPHRRQTKKMMFREGIAVCYSKYTKHSVWTTCRVSDCYIRLCLWSPMCRGGSSVGAGGLLHSKTFPEKLNILIKVFFKRHVRSLKYEWNHL